MMDRLTFKNDGEAWNYLEERGYTDKHFVIQLPIRDMAEGEWDAVGYLCNEWDWDCYDTRKDQAWIIRKLRSVKYGLLKMVRGIKE